MTRQRSVPYNMEDTTSTERLLADSYQNQPPSHRSAHDIRGCTPQHGSSLNGDRHKSTFVGSGRTGSRSHRPPSKKERSEKRSDRSRSRSRSSHQNNAGTAAGHSATNGALRSGLFKQSDSSQPLLALRAQVMKSQQ